MNKTIILIILFSLTVLAQNTIKSGEINNSAKDGYSGAVSGTWTSDTVKIVGDIYIPEDSVLTINPNVNVYFTGEYSFNVYGTLLAEGTAQNNINFFSDSLAEITTYPYYKGFWKGINFLGTDSTNQQTSILKFCNIRYSFEKWIDQIQDRIGGAIVVYKSKVNLEDVSFDSCQGRISGGIYINGSDVAFTNIYLNKIIYDYAVYAINSYVRFEGGEITDGVGAIKLSNSKLSLKNFIIDNNHNQYAKGAGIYSENSNLEIYDTEISNNSAYSSGGGLYVEYGNSIKLNRVQFINNSSTGEGGGATFNFCNPELVNVKFSYNKAGYGGGALSVSGTTSTANQIKIANGLFYKNELTETSGSGAAILLGNKITASIINSTIADNICVDFAALGSAWGNSVANVENTIIYNNGTNTDLQVQGDNNKYTYSLIQGYYAGQDTSTTNLHNVDPLFRNVADEDYRLKFISCGGTENSQAIDAGNPAIVDFVLDCEAGLKTYRSDMGAYGGAANRWDVSLIPPCYYSGEVSGEWDCDEVMVEGDLVILPNQTLTIKPGVTVNFLGNYKLDVQGTLNAVGFLGDSIKFVGVSEFGFRGIKLHKTASNQSIANFQYCKFINGNVANEGLGNNYGGAIYIKNTEFVSLIDCEFSNNKAYLGGAIYIENASPYLELIKFNGNTATGAGGAIYFENCNHELSSSAWLLELIDNSANNGGAIFASNSTLRFGNVLGIRNKSLQAGAFGFLFNSTVEFVNLTSSKNYSNTNSGGSFSLMNSNVSLLNSILFANSDNEIYFNSGTANANYSLIYNGSTQSYFGVGCIDADPNFRDTLNNNFHLSSLICGPSTNSIAIDAGDPNSIHNDYYLSCAHGLGTVRADMGYYGGMYSDCVVGVEEENTTQIPTEYMLEQNYPNPFNPSTTISFRLPEQSQVVLKIYDALGREVTTLVNDEMKAGSYNVQWTATDFASGIYFYRLSAGKFSQTKKLMLLK